ncbi:MAG: hypothetical protein Q9166_007797 [cf. Caloplaca sp. 2 TL-2023]
MLGKRKSSRHVAPVKKRKKGEPVIEEITFNFDAREEYLTGFHKRKLQRIKHAKEEALKKEREEKVASRKALRETRKAALEKHVEAVNAALQDAEDAFEKVGSSGEEDEPWDGLEEAVKVDHEDDYLDEDKHTVVTVEAVDVSHEGLQRRQNESNEEGEDANANVLAGKSTSGNMVNGTKVQRSQTNRGPKQLPKKKKKKFRYESKAERKVTRIKERSGSKAKAKERRAK